jgi:hypothetical protein
MQQGALLALGLVGGLAAVASGQIELLGSFNPAEGAGMNAIGFNPDRDEVFVHFNHDASVHVYDRSGVFLRAFAKPSGNAGNDGDLEFADEAVDIGGTIVPADALLVIENDNEPPRIVAADAVTGAVLAEQAFPANEVGQWTGGSYHHGRDTFFCSDWSADVVQEVDAGDGTVLGALPINPEGSPGGFDFFYSDVEVLRATGTLYLFSDAQPTLRVMTAEGVWVADFPIGSLGVGSMSGIAFDDARGEAWISSTNGNVYHLGGFDAFEGDPCSDADLTLPFGTLDFFDVQLFLQYFSSHNAAADMNGDGVYDFFDVQAYLQAFSAGCP